MEKTIILGKQGNQPFEIKGELVSRKHAEIIVSDNGEWLLRDLHSTNGTYVRNEQTGEMKRVGEVRITPMTFVILGSEGMLGCSFYAKQCLNYGDFKEELLYMRSKEEWFDGEEERLRKKYNLINILVRFAAAMAVLAISFLVTSDNSNLTMFIRFGVMGCAAYLVPFFYDVNKARKKMKSQKESFHKCPNPECSHVMSSNEIMDACCAKCHCH